MITKKCVIFHNCSITRAVSRGAVASRQVHCGNGSNGLSPSDTHVNRLVNNSPAEWSQSCANHAH